MNRNAVYESLLKQTCDIYRVTSSINSYFEKIPGPETLVDSDVPCFAAFPTGRKVVMPAGIDPSKLRLFYFKYDQDVKELDIIVGGNRRYIVNSVDMAGLKDHHLEAMCETVVGG